MHDKRYVSSKALQSGLPLNGAVTTMPNRRTMQDMTLKDVKLQWLGCMFIIYFMALAFVVVKKIYIYKW